jgi:hypothetical protein
MNHETHTDEVQHLPGVAVSRNADGFGSCVPRLPLTTMTACHLTAIVSL